MNNVYKFNRHAADIPEESLKLQYEQMLLDYKNPKSNVWGKFHCNIESIVRDGYVRRSGYAFDIRHVLKAYLVKDCCNILTIRKFFCINRTVLRNLVSTENKKLLKIADCPANF